MEFNHSVYWASVTRLVRLLDAELPATPLVLRSRSQVEVWVSDGPITVVRVVAWLDRVQVSLCLGAITWLGSPVMSL